MGVDAKLVIPGVANIEEVLKLVAYAVQGQEFAGARICAYLGSYEANFGLSYFKVEFRWNPKRVSVIEAKRQNLEERSLGVWHGVDVFQDVEQPYLSLSLGWWGASDAILRHIALSLKKKEKQVFYQDQDFDGEFIEL